MRSPSCNPLATSPALIPFISLAVGIIISIYGGGLIPGCCLITLGAAVSLYILAKKNRPMMAYRLAKYHWIWICLWFAGLGTILGDLARPFSQPGDDFSQFVAARGKVIEISDRTSGERLCVEINQLIEPSGKVIRCNNFKILIHTDITDSKSGDEITFPVNLKRITDSPNSFFSGYAKNWSRRGIYYSQTIEGKVIIIEKQSRSIKTRAIDLRNSMAGFIESSPLDKKTSYFLNALLLGDRAYLLPETRELFVNAGIAHVLALSGLHIGILAGVILFLFFPINFAGLYRWRLLLTALLLWFYAILTGMTPSTVRACIMISLVFISIFTQRKSTAFNALCVAGLIILLFDPLTLLDVGFQLSFVCVASIILFVNRLNFVDQRTHNKTYKLIGVLLTTLITTFTTWIIIAYYYKQFPASFIPANLLILPLLPLFIITSLLYFLFYAFGIDFPWMTRFIDGFYALIEWIAAKTGSSEASIVDISPSVVSVILWFFGIALIAFTLYSKQKKVCLYSGIGFCLISIIFIPFYTTENPKDNLLICDTYHAVEIKVRKGQREESHFFPAGKTSLIEFPGHAIINLGSPETKESLLAKKEDLLKNSDRSVEMLIITEANRLPLPFLLECFSPRLIVIHPSVSKKKEALYLTTADSLSLPIHSLRSHPLSLP